MGVAVVLIVLCLAAAWALSGGGGQDGPSQGMWR